MYLEPLSISVPVSLNVFLTMSTLLDCRTRKVLHLSAESWCLSYICKLSTVSTFLQLLAGCASGSIQDAHQNEWTLTWHPTCWASAFCTQQGTTLLPPQTPEPMLSRGHPYTSLAAGPGDFQSLIPGNFSFSNKHFRLMIKMEVGRGGTAATTNPEGKRVFDHSKGKLVNLSWTDFNYVQY